ncbi:aminoacyl-tRNA hydrolase [Halanaerocella petrolearia]
MKLVVGLGNPGTKYQSTRHNAGFMVVDKLADYYHTRISCEEHKAMVGKIKVSGETVILAKPQTFMNKSGQAIEKLVSYYQIDIEDILVIYDDLDLKPGQLRIRPKGGHGGHNGLKSIFACLGEKKFSRIRIGIGRPEQGTVTDHVLGRFTKDEWSQVDETLDQAREAVKLYLDKDDLNLVMNKYN